MYVSGCPRVLARRQADRQTTTRVCKLSLDDASDLCTLLSLINALAIGGERRHELVGNWLWCLRSSVKPVEARGRTKRRKTSRERGGTGRPGERGEGGPSGAGAVSRAVGLGPEYALTGLITGTMNETGIRTPPQALPPQPPKSAVWALERHNNDGDVYRRVRHWRAAINCDDQRDRAPW